MYSCARQPFFAHTYSSETATVELEIVTCVQRNIEELFWLCMILTGCFSTLGSSSEVY
jgi:hypothetical protein